MKEEFIDIVVDDHAKICRDHDKVNPCQYLSHVPYRLQGNIISSHPHPSTASNALNPPLSANNGSLPIHNLPPIWLDLHPLLVPLLLPATVPKLSAPVNKWHDHRFPSHQRPRIPRIFLLECCVPVLAEDTGGICAPTSWPHVYRKI